MIRPLLLAAIAALALSACGDDPAPEPQADDNRRAEGEIQGGTISDAMIPLDTLTSQSPPMKRRPASAGGTEGENEAVEPSGDTDQDAAAEPTEPDAAPATEETPAEE